MYVHSVQVYMYMYIIKSEKNWLNSYQKQFGNYVNIFLLAVIYLFRWVIFLLNNRVSWEKNSVLILVVVVFWVVLLACIITSKTHVYGSHLQLAEAFIVLLYIIQGYPLLHTHCDSLRRISSQQFYLKIYLYRWFS